MKNDTCQTDVNNTVMDGSKNMVSQTNNIEAPSGGIQKSSKVTSSEEDENTMTQKESSSNDATVLGKPTGGHHVTKNNHHSDSSHGDLRKVSVSPRVELMLNNELFKKYLRKNGNLLDRLSQQQGRRRGGMKKAFSNLDLSQIDLEEEFRDPFLSKKNEKSNTNKASVENDKKSDKSLEPKKVSQNPAKQRSMSLIGHNDPHLHEIQAAIKLHEQNNVEKKNKKVTQIAAADRKTRFLLPSFEDFKRSRREKLMKGQAYVRSVVNNKENFPVRLLKDLHSDSNVESSQISDEKSLSTHNDSLNRSLPESHLRELLSQNISDSHPESASILDSEKVNVGENRIENTAVKSAESSKTEDITLSGKEEKEIEINSVDQRGMLNGPEKHSIDIENDCDNISEQISDAEIPKSNEKIIKVKEAKSTSSAPECVKSSGSPSRSSKTKRAPSVPREISGRHQTDNVLQSPAVSPTRGLEISTDGTTVYAYLKISSSDSVNGGSEGKEDVGDSGHQNEIEAKSVTQQQGKHCNNSESKVKVKMVCGDVNCTFTNRCDSCLNGILENDSLQLKTKYSSASYGEHRLLPSVPQKNSDERNTRPTHSASSPDTPTARTILKACRKRKLPGKPRNSQKSETKDPSSKMTHSRTWPKLTHSASIDLSGTKQQESSMRPPKSRAAPPPPLSRSTSCEVFTYNNFLDAESPCSSATFSFPNSPAYDGTSVFIFPSPSGSLTNSEADLSPRSEQEREDNSVSLSTSYTEALPADSKNIVMRSTSDVTANTSDTNRRRRERKLRPYKSEPFAGSGNLPGNRLSYFPLEKHRHNTGSIRDDLSDFPDDASLVEVDENEEIECYKPSQTDRKIKHRLSNISDISTDSGMIGQEGIPDAPPSPSSSQTSLFSSQHSTGQDSAIETSEQGHNYTDIDERSFMELDTNIEKAMLERKETILEIRDTEVSYGRDLSILKEEFYKPLKKSGLLNTDQLEAIFLNLEELIHVNSMFTSLMDSAVEVAQKRNDVNLTEVVIGDLFLKSTNLIMTFENYCVNQSQATILLEQLERERELLAIFLKVYQDEHPALRRMHLKSFLMVPVQRVMRYPLLLERLYKATPRSHHDKEAIFSAKTKIEAILERINAKAKSAGQAKLMKRKSSEKRPVSVSEKVEVTRVAMEVLCWHKQEVCDVITSQLQVSPQGDNWATKRLRNIRFTPVHAVLLTLGQNAQLKREEDNGLLFPQTSSVIQAAVVLLKEKNGKFQTFREPFLLNRCIVNIDVEIPNTFELLELNKETYLFKCDDQSKSKLWVQNVKQQTLNLGSWRKRRNALPNIMINHLV